MTTHEHSLSTGVPAARETKLPLWHLARTFGTRVLEWTRICVDYWTAAAMYEHLAALSDAELACRGLSRATLARDVRVAYDPEG